MHKAIVLFSSGLDSTISLLKTIDDGYETIPIYIIRKAWATAQELPHAQAIVDILVTNKHRCAPLMLIRADPSWNYGDKLLNRDLYYITVLAANAAACHKAKFIVFGQELSSDRYRPEDTVGRFSEAGPDEILRMANEYFSKNGIDIRLMITNSRDIKVDMVRRYLPLFEKYGISPFQTFSCWHIGKNGKECGRCEHCIRKYLAFRNAGYTRARVVDHFAVDPLKRDQTEKLDSMLAFAYKNRDWPTVVELARGKEIIAEDLGKDIVRGLDLW